MILTEEEARQKWCPHNRNRESISGSMQNEPRCIASDCMMWEWSEEMFELRHDEVPPEGEGWKRVGAYWQRKLVARKGYCGLAH